MKDKKPSDDKHEDRQAKSSAHDITPVLTDWEYEPGTLNVRKITGLDGLPKLQLRLDLGLLQMEMTLILTRTVRVKQSRFLTHQCLKPSPQR